MKKLILLFLLGLLVSPAYAQKTGAGNAFGGGSGGGSGGSGLSDGDKGDITVSSSASVFSINSSRVTNAMLAGSIANAKLANSAITIAGTSTSLGGSITASSILDSIGSTRGSLLLRGVSGWSAATPGTSGYVWTSNGTGADPSWQAASGGGGLSGLTTGAILKAASATTAADSVLSESSSNLILGGNGVLRSTVTGARLDFSGAASSYVDFGTGAGKALYFGDSGLGRVTTKVTGATDGSGNVNGGWFTDAGFKRVSANFDKAGNTTLGDITGATVALQSGRTYFYTFTASYDADATGGQKWAIAYSGTSSAIEYRIKSTCDSSGLFVITSRQTSSGGSAGHAGCTAGEVVITGSITTTSTGNLTAQFAQNASSGTSTVRAAGSSFHTRDVP